MEHLLSCFTLVASFVVLVAFFAVVVCVTLVVCFTMVACFTFKACFIVPLVAFFTVARGGLLQFANSFLHCISSFLRCGGLPNRGGLLHRGELVVVEL